MAVSSSGGTSLRNWERGGGSISMIAIGDYGNRPDERRSASEESIKNDTQRPNVCAPVDIARGTQLLGGDVEHRAHRPVGRRQFVFAFDLGDTKIENFEDAPVPLAQKKVGGS